MYETYPSKSPSTIGEQKTGKDKFTPKSPGGKDGKPGHPSGKTRYPSQRPSSGSRFTGKEKQVPVWADGGGNVQVSRTYPKKLHTEKNEKRLSRDNFVPCNSGRTAPDKR